MAPVAEVVANSAPTAKHAKPPHTESSHCPPLVTAVERAPVAEKTMEQLISCGGMGLSLLRLTVGYYPS